MRVRRNCVRGPFCAAWIATDILYEVHNQLLVFAIRKSRVNFAPKCCIVTIQNSLQRICVHLAKVRAREAEPSLWRKLINGFTDKCDSSGVIRRRHCGEKGHALSMIMFCCHQWSIKTIEADQVESTQFETVESLMMCTQWKQNQEWFEICAEKFFAPNFLFWLLIQFCSWPNLHNSTHKTTH